MCFSSSTPSLAPLKAGGIPSGEEGRATGDRREAARRLTLSRSIPSFYDAAGSIGRRYRRQDEAGTPWCITVDGQTLRRWHGHDPGPGHARAGAGRRRGCAGLDPGAGWPGNPVT